MKYFTTFLFLTVSLVIISCCNSAFADETRINRKSVKSFPKKQEIITWKRALETETTRLVDAGNNNLEDIINIVSENTYELEQPTLVAYINQCIEMSKFGNELAQEASAELQNPELDKFNQVISEQVNNMMEESCRKKNEDNFSERRNSLIEYYFQKATVSE